MENTINCIAFIVSACLPYLVVSEIITYNQNEKWKKRMEKKIDRLLDNQKE